MPMRNEQSGVPEIDLLAIRDALKLRWWIVPAVMLVSVGFLFANESNLATVPGSVTVTKTYDALDESSVLRLVGIDPKSIVPYPSFDNQLRVLQSPETRAEISAAINSDAEVSITPTDRKFLVIESQERSIENQFLLRREGTPMYEFECTAPTADVCSTVIDAYITKLTDLRRSSINTGFERAIKIVSDLSIAGGSNMKSLDEILGFLEYAKKLLTGELSLITTRSRATGPTISTVKASTYLFGVGISAMIGLLIILQLTISDRKIRTERKLVKSVGADLVLGVICNDPKNSGNQQAAAAIAFRSSEQNASTVRLIPIDAGVDANAVTAILSGVLSGTSLTIDQMAPIDNLGAAELLSPANSVVVLVATARTSKTDVLKQALAATERAGNFVAGVILAM